MARARKSRSLLPAFTAQGHLPPGDHELTIEELRRSMLVEGPGPEHPAWDAAWRVELYPHFGQLSGLRDAHGNELEFPSAFRLSRRDGSLRGIVKIAKGGGA
jgi:hypothetical protein